MSMRRPNMTKDFFSMMKLVDGIDYPPKRKKPWLHDDFLAMEVFDYGNFGPIPTIPGDAPPVTNECFEWFYNTIIVSGNDWFNNPKFIDMLRESLDVCEKWRLYVLGCMHYNSLSFCMCCSAIGSWDKIPKGTCDQDFGPVADEEWNCCGGTCPQFNIGVKSLSALSVCYGIQTAECETRVSWQSKAAGAPESEWAGIEPDPCFEVGDPFNPGCPVDLRATDLCGEKALYVHPAGAGMGISGSDTITKSSSSVYSAACPCSPTDAITWEVSGTGATIDASGTLVTDATACGTLTVIASSYNCETVGKEVRVTDGGVWSPIFLVDHYDVNCTAAPSPCVVNCAVVNSIAEGKRYNVTRYCAANELCPAQSVYDADYSSYLSAGGVGCVGECPSGCELAHQRDVSHGMSIEQWVCP